MKKILIGVVITLIVLVGGCTALMGEWQSQPLTQ